MYTLIERNAWAHIHWFMNLTDFKKGFVVNITYHTDAILNIHLAIIVIITPTIRINHNTLHISRKQEQTRSLFVYFLVIPNETFTTYQAHYWYFTCTKKHGYPIVKPGTRGRVSPRKLKLVRQFVLQNVQNVSKCHQLCFRASFVKKYW